MRNYPGVRKRFLFFKEGRYWNGGRRQERVGGCLNASPKMRGEEDGWEFSGTHKNTNLHIQIGS